jgi:ankyrin repeat protein
MFKQSDHFKNTIHYTLFVDIHTAAKRGNIDGVDWWLKRGVDVDKGNKNLETPLMIACGVKNNIKMVEFLIKNGASIFGVKRNNEAIRLINPFCFAININDLEIIEFLLKHQKDNQIPRIQGLFTYAIETNNKALVKLFLDYGYTLNEFKTQNLDLKGDSIIIDTYEHPLDNIITYNKQNYEMADFLIDNYEDTLEPNKTNQNNILHQSIQDDNLKLAEYLIKKAPYLLNKTNLQGNTPLHLLIIKRQATVFRIKDSDLSYNLIKLLLEKGVFLEVKNKANQTPLKLAIYFDDTLAIELLSNYNYNRTHKNNFYLFKSESDITEKTEDTILFKYNKK